MTAGDSKRWSNFIFAGLFALALILFSRILLPFLMPVLLGGFLVVLFMPIQDSLDRRLQGRKSLTAGLSTLAVFLLILAPLALVGWMVAREVLQFVGQAQDLLDQVDLRHHFLNSLPRGLSRYVHFDPESSETERLLMTAVSGGAGLLADVVGAGTELIVNMFLMTVAMYYFFLDGRRLVNEVARLIPLERRYFDAFSHEFTDVAYAIIYGNTVTALVQGAVGFVGLLIAGVPHAGVWGAAMVLVALVPVGGTALVWGPIGVILVAANRVSEGVFLLAWGTFLVGSIDNVIRPRLCGSRMALHPLLVFLSMFGGLAVFGMMGLLVGPLIASIFMAMVRIYRRDFLGRAQESQPAPVVSQDSSPSLTPQPAPVPSAASVGHVMNA
ncbi:AI-2E family transporter [Corallococcus exiguus]|uniref:AI-2E family transporter n=1 Tax=Corallococcus TaxID=83461 RepID=UPI000ED5A254|nr:MULTISPECIES: AI-2E family transporter [unclassified Corallococcus]NNB87105.1 AI-2E family transporter [Corallococcus exiguus]NNB94706.1 AI-2E family transporter [Corallococcus exiguus]NNC03278.1 AI-2E family transporter [Corallococcus exiguus]NPC52117.1 AI-2E family transporter [Corallococcus exiguus]RKH82180.1 AI-2E family transporter [Corallococcus sp. AB032C]